MHMPVRCGGGGAAGGHPPPSSGAPACEDGLKRSNFESVHTNLQIQTHNNIGTCGLAYFGAMGGKLDVPKNCLLWLASIRVHSAR